MGQVTAQLAPILPEDIPAVAQFLHEQLNPRVAAASWAKAIDCRWVEDAPNHGFQLLDEGRVVGAHIAFYSVRDIDGGLERVCNLGAWCVLESHRFQGLKLLRALLAQADYSFTDLSPSGSVVPLNTRLKFGFLDTTTALVPNLPWPSWPGQLRISEDPGVIESVVQGTDLKIYRDHAALPAAYHVVMTQGQTACYVIFRRDRRKHLPLFASVLHVGDREAFSRFLGPFSRYLLLRHGMPATLAELRVVGRRPPLSILLKTHRRKMFRSERLEASQIDYLYSELVCVPW